MSGHLARCRVLRPTSSPAGRFSLTSGKLPVRRSRQTATLQRLAAPIHHQLSIDMSRGSHLRTAQRSQTKPGDVGTTRQRPGLADQHLSHSCNLHGPNTCPSNHTFSVCSPSRSALTTLVRFAAQMHKFSSRPQAGVAFVVGGVDDDEALFADVGVAGPPGAAPAPSQPQADQVRDFFPESFLFSIETLP